MQITIDQSFDKNGLANAGELKQLAQYTLRAFVSEVQFVRVSVFRFGLGLAKPGFEVTCFIKTRSGFATGTYHGKGTSAALALEQVLQAIVDRLSTQFKAP